MQNAPAAKVSTQTQPWLRRVVRAASVSMNGRGAAPLHEILSGLGHADHEIIALARFDDRGYVRRILHQDDRVQVMVIGWLPGQASEVHDHRGSLCGFRVVQGDAAESIYDASGVGQVFESVRVHHRPGDVVVSGEADIHKMFIEPASEKPLITLHVYTPPLRMKTYEEAPPRALRERL
jgi:cysteine dioxygenase